MKRLMILSAVAVMLASLSGCCRMRGWLGHGAECAPACNDYESSYPAYSGDEYQGGYVGPVQGAAGLPGPVIEQLPEAPVMAP